MFIKTKITVLEMKIKYAFYWLVLFLLFTEIGYGQCAMCRASLQNDANQATAQGINDGIVYLMAIPYVLVAVAAYAVYRIKFYKKKDI